MVDLDVHLRAARRLQKQSAAESTLLDALLSVPGHAWDAAKSALRTGKKLYKSTEPSEKFLNRASPSTRLAERVGFFTIPGLAASAYLGGPSPQKDVYAAPFGAADSYMQARQSLRQGEFPEPFM